MKRVLYISLGLILMMLASCYNEIIIDPEGSHGVYNFLVTPEQEEKINNSRGVNFEILDPIPDLLIERKEYPLDRFEIRGESSLKFWRKSFSINMDTNLFFYIDQENLIRDIEEYKLISLVYDYTYIEGAIAIGLFHQLDLWPTHSEYTEVRLNDHTQGVYLLIEDPVEYFLYQRNASFILRRGYNHIVKKFVLNGSKLTQSEEFYLAGFDSIYSYISRYTGSQLYDSLMTKLDMQQYFTKMVVDMLVQNGDYTDEVYFYTKESDDSEIFGIYPWDYDDLFMEVPHEVGRDWAVGTIFGNRSYNSAQDIVDDVGERLIFSIEDDLDYIIAVDDYLYQRYLYVLEDIMRLVDAQRIESIIIDAKEQLQPFYDNEHIISLSFYDESSTSQELFDKNLSDKKNFMLSRRDWILQELPKHKN